MGTSVGGVLSGVNPFDYNASSPITLFLFQTCLILLMCNLVNIPFSKIGQPKVISEVIAGVILGPTVLGQIPNYTETIFPKSSVVGLNLTANLGIILFMFFLGLEVDTAFIRKHLKTALSIGLTTLAVPFGCGCLLAIPLFNTYANKDVNARHIKFSVFMVFIAVSMSVTAFPVLCRILNELRLIKDRVGVVVLAAGIINDIIGWVLLALSVILSTSELSPVNTVYILLCTFGWFLLYFYPLKYILKWALVKGHELDRSKPSPFATMCILFIMFISAYFTDIIGVHPIFGAFIAGLIVPRDNNYVVKLAERMEDIPNIVLIPIYFAVAGLNVDLTLLNEGKDWGYVFASIGVAIASKILSGSVVANLFGLFRRESLAVGILMSCKGIVEIVVLTVGLNAQIINQKIFGMFILMALVSTFVTTPFTLLAYPNSYRMKVQEYLNKQEEGSEDMAPMTSNELETEKYQSKLANFEDICQFSFTNVVNIINTAECISSSLELLNHIIYHNQPNKLASSLNLQELSRLSSATTEKSRSSKLKKLAVNWIHKEETVSTPMSAIDEEPLGFDVEVPLKVIHLRLLTERTADLLQSSSLYNEDPFYYANTDSTLQIFDIFSRLSKVPFSSEIIFSTVREKAINITTHTVISTDLVILPLKGASYEYKSNTVPAEEQYPNFEHVFSHVLGVNELSSNFFECMARGLKSNVAFQISNTGGLLHVDRYKPKNFCLLLPNANLSSSDFLALYFLMMICYKNINSGSNINALIFFNSKNMIFLEQLQNTFSNQPWFDDSLITTVPITMSAKGYDNAENDTFVASVLSKYWSVKGEESLQGSTFIIPEVLFSGQDPFDEDTKSTILYGANKKFDVIILHKYSEPHNQHI